MPTLLMRQTSGYLTFRVKATTHWGENVYLVGSTPLLSNWEPASAIKLSPATYPIWNVTVSLPAATNLEYKFVKRDEGGSVVWESGNNRQLTTPAAGATTGIDEEFR